MRRIETAVIGFGVLLAACGSPSTETSSSPSVPTEATPSAEAHPLAGEEAWIAYQTNKSGSEGIWLIHPDGTDDHQVGRDIEGDHVIPDWSPDGARLSYSAQGIPGEPIFEYDLETETSTQLFDCEDPCIGDGEGAYSPDGNRIVFSRALGPFKFNEDFGEDAPSDCGLWIGDIASGEVEQITSNRQCNREWFPRWSPDGTKIAYHREKYSKDVSVETAVFVIDADGSNETQLTEWNMNGTTPDWSPHGEWIVFGTHGLNTFGSGVASDLYLIRPDGTGLEPLTEYSSETERATQPRYTPDGDRIVFTIDDGSSRTLWVLPLDGGEPIQVAAGGIYTHGTWQPV